MSGKKEGADLHALEGKLEAAFNYLQGRVTDGFVSNEHKGAMARGLADVTEALLEVRRQRIAEENGGKVSKPLKVG